MVPARSAHTAAPGTAPLPTVLANAPSCSVPRHPRQDLGAIGHEDVSPLIEVGLPVLFHSNLRHLRWKRDLFLQPGRGGLRPPKRDGRGDCDVCFGADAAALRNTWPPTPPH